MLIINGMPRPALAFPITNLTAPADPLGRASLLVGWAFIETTGNTPAAFDIIDGNGSGGTLVAPIALDGGQSRQDNAPGIGLFCQAGPFVNAISGTWRGALWLIIVSEAELRSATWIG